MTPPLLTVNKNQKDEYKKWMEMFEARLKKTITDWTDYPSVWKDFDIDSKFEFTV